MLTSLSIFALRSARMCRSSKAFSTLAGPSSRRTSSAFFNKLGGNPIGRSRASSEAGKLRVCNVLVFVLAFLQRANKTIPLVSGRFKLLGCSDNLFRKKVVLSVIIDAWSKVDIDDSPDGEVALTNSLSCSPSK